MCDDKTFNYFSSEHIFLIKWLQKWQIFYPGYLLYGGYFYFRLKRECEQVQ